MADEPDDHESPTDKAVRLMKERGLKSATFTGEELGLKRPGIIKVEVHLFGPDDEMKWETVRRDDE